MIRGEYEVKIGDRDPVVVPNQFTIVGIQLILKAAFWQEIPVLAMGLCAHNPASMLSLSAVQEPAVANGYARQNVPMDQANWPIFGSINGETYIESREVSFLLTAPVSLPVNRLFLTDGTQVVSISSEFEGGLQLYGTTITTKYRLFFM